ncbi:hypothetical protein [Streptomyces hawaiiensis]|uniref:hypothetical protein n=1 Tax=Streptomyces hawaiiensis TaxID=67305 RepID=UPI001FE921D4|nr:hypothetical protein [Streptomyces hawaiiensis]
MLDSTPLDVLVVLAEGVTGSVELSIALDVATRSICAAVVRPVGTRSVDAAGAAGADGHAHADAPGVGDGAGDVPVSHPL